MILFAMVGGAGHGVSARVTDPSAGEDGTPKGPTDIRVAEPVDLWMRTRAPIRTVTVGPGIPPGRPLKLTSEVRGL